MTIAAASPPTSARTRTRSPINTPRAHRTRSAPLTPGPPAAAPQRNGGSPLPQFPFRLPSAHVRAHEHAPSEVNTLIASSVVPAPWRVGDRRRREYFGHGGVARLVGCGSSAGGVLDPEPIHDAQQQAFAALVLPASASGIDPCSEWVDHRRVSKHRNVGTRSAGWANSRPSIHNRANWHTGATDWRSLSSRSSDGAGGWPHIHRGAPRELSVLLSSTHIYWRRVDSHRPEPGLTRCVAIDVPGSTRRRRWDVPRRVLRRHRVVRCSITPPGTPPSFKEHSRGLA